MLRTGNLDETFKFRKRDGNVGRKDQESDVRSERWRMRRCYEMLLYRTLFPYRYKMWFRDISKDMQRCEIFDSRCSKICKIDARTSNRVSDSIKIKWLSRNSRSNTLALKCTRTQMHILTCTQNQIVDTWAQSLQLSSQPLQCRENILFNLGDASYLTLLCRMQWNL